VPTLTAAYSAILALMLVALSICVIRLRVIHGVSLGDGGEKRLERAVRGQANFAEYVPMALILILCLELLKQPPWLVHAAGATLVAGRVAHGICFGFCESAPRLRQAGMLLTFAALIIAAVGNLAAVFVGAF
jgi:uncharacterized membrane protein YecN with MAPEG domain